MAAGAPPSERATPASPRRRDHSDTAIHALLRKLAVRNRRHGYDRHLAPGLALAVACAVVLCACGSTSRPGAQTSTRTNSLLAAAECMRAHGVPNFPDPQRGPGGAGMTVNISPDSSTVTIDGIPFSGPAFQAAQKTCKPFGGADGRPPITEHQALTLLAFARCMRQHGLPEWSDPTFPAGGGIMGGGGPYPHDSPAVKHAATICNKTVLHQSAD